MGDIIKPFNVRNGDTGKGVPLRLYFDSGSPVTFVKATVAEGLGGAMPLKAPRRFGGLGSGLFYAPSLIELSIRFLDVWCPQVAYVVADATLERRYDILLGHDAMQRYDIHLRPREHEVRLDRDALQMALKVRSPIVPHGQEGASWQSRRSGRR